MTNGARVALITGSGRNIGRGCAKALAREGFNIIVNGSQDEAACARVADEVRAIGTEAMVAMGDVGNQSAVDDMVRAIQARFGGVDALINNAAIRPHGPFLDITDDELARIMNVNCYASVWLSRAFLPGMIERGWGRIVNFSGMNSMKGTAGRAHISMSKHAVWGLSKVLAREYGPKGITANTISPGTFPDEDADISQMPRMQELMANNPARRLGTAQDIAALVALLCSDNGGFINGQLLRVNGGVEG